MGRGPGVRAVGNEAIQLDFRWKKVRYRERLRLRPTEANVKYVRRLKATIEHEIATGTFDYAKHFPGSKHARPETSPSISVADAMSNYLDGLENEIEPETMQDYRYSAKIVASWFPGKTLQSLTRADVRNKVSKIQLSKKRIFNLLLPLRGTCAQAVDDEILKASPVSKLRIRRITVKKEAIDPFTHAEIGALAETELGYLWQFWAWTGLRTSELIGLRGSDVGNKSASLTVRRSVRRGREKGTKTGAGHRVLNLLPAARHGMGRRPGSDVSLPLDDPLFRNPNTGKRWHDDIALRRAFRKACKAAGVRYRYPYQLRHTFASWALSSGENPLWVAQQMGHKDVRMIFQHYGKYMPSLNPRAGEKMSKVKGKLRAA